MELESALATWAKRWMADLNRMKVPFVTAPGSGVRCIVVIGRTLSAHSINTIFIIDYL
jgi:hypothetical protein